MAVAVLKPKPKTTVLRRNQTATEPRISGGHVTVFSNFKNGPARSQTFPNNSLIIPSAGLTPAPFEVTDWPPGVELPDSLITCRDKLAFVLLLAPSGLTRTYRWTPSHASQICEWREEIRLIDAHVSKRDHHDYYSLQLKKKKHVIHPMQINIVKKLL